MSMNIEAENEALDSYFKARFIRQMTIQRGCSSCEGTGAAGPFLGRCNACTGLGYYVVMDEEAIRRLLEGDQT